MPYFADATSLRPGSIVRVEKPLSSSGRPTYPHSFIVLQVGDTLRIGDLIPLVGISSRIDPGDVNAAKHVEMKRLNRKGGDPETGFTVRCHACMDFTHVLEVYRGTRYELEVAADHQGKFIRADKFHTVVAAMNAWTRRIQLGSHPR